MEERAEIFIKRIIVHIMDINLQMPIISDEEHPLDSDVNDYISKHISKVLRYDDLKTAKFLNNSKIKALCDDILKQYNDFCNLTGQIANTLYNIMIKNVDIPSADLICSLFELNNVLYLGILKFNYRFSFIHFVANLDTGKQNKLIRQKTTLPAENQKIDECALINLNDFSIKLLEKKYEIDGEKRNYFSEIFLECTSDISNNEKVKIFNKATETFNKKYCNEDFRKEIEIKKAVSESIEQNNEININSVAESVFKSNPDMQNSYIKCIEEAGLKHKSIVPSEKLIEKNFKKQTLKTDTGIEINIPIDYYKDKEKIEFLNNVDGTISIIIKNVNKIINK